jgi:AcrR family transcriptional regulator
VASTSSSSREVLLRSAEDLLREDPAEPLSVRAVCARAGVQFPTLYHFFVNKQGLLDAVADRGFDVLAEAIAATPTADARVAVRAIWDAYLSMATDLPARVALMHGATSVGVVPQGAVRVWTAIAERLEPYAAAGALTMPSPQAAWHVNAAAVGAALAVVADTSIDAGFVAAAREATVRAVVRDAGSTTDYSVSGRARELLSAIEAQAPAALSGEETAMLSAWLRRLADQR